jgi:hypothetical protein
LFGRESIDLANKERITADEIQFYVTKNPKMDFYNILIGLNFKNLSFRPNITSEDEKAFQLFIDVYGILLKEYHFKNGVGLWLLEEKGSFRNMILVMDQSVMDSIEGRTFDDADKDLAKEGKAINKREKSARFLLEHGVDKNSVYKNQSILYYAVEDYFSEEFVKYLISLGCDRAYFQESFTSLRTSQNYLEPINRGSSKIFKILKMKF